MERQSRCLTQCIVLIVATLLWFNPLCLLPEGYAARHESVTIYDQGHRPHHPALCDDHLFHMAGLGHDADIRAKAGIGVRLPPLPGLPYDQFSVVTRSELEFGPLSAPPSALRVSSKALYTLHSAYLI